MSPSTEHKAWLPLLLLSSCPPSSYQLLPGGRLDKRSYNNSNNNISGRLSTPGIPINYVANGAAKPIPPFLSMSVDEF